MPERSWDTSVWVADSGRMERKLGWRAEVGLEIGHPADESSGSATHLECSSSTGPARNARDRRPRVRQDSAAMTRSPTCSGPIPCRA